MNEMKDFFVKFFFKWK